jgi:hypothetical protein
MKKIEKPFFDFEEMKFLAIFQLGGEADVELKNSKFLLVSKIR